MLKHSEKCTNTPMNQFVTWWLHSFWLTDFTEFTRDFLFISDLEYLFILNFKVLKHNRSFTSPLTRYTHMLVFLSQCCLCRLIRTQFPIIGKISHITDRETGVPRLTKVTERLSMYKELCSQTPKQVLHHTPFQQQIDKCIEHLDYF